MFKMVKFTFNTILVSFLIQIYLDRYRQLRFIKFKKKFSHAKVTTGVKYCTSKKLMPCKQKVLCK